MTHIKDSDCRVSPVTLMCEECGVDHSSACPECGGRGFHKDRCSQVPNWAPLQAVVTPEQMNDFMFMGVVPISGIIRYKHCDTRRYLNIGPLSLRTYRFLSLTGQYVLISRDEALQHVFA